jgi:cytidylate kinase
MRIIISGLSGTGKSTVAKILAKKLNLKYVSPSQLLIKLSGRDDDRKGFMESEKGMKFMEEREKDHSLDKKLDDLMLQTLEEDNVIVDSWTMAYLYKKGLKVWLHCSYEERIRRVAEREGKNKEEVEKYVIEKEKRTFSLFKKLYGIEFDWKKYHLIINSEFFSPEEIAEIIERAAIFWEHKKDKEDKERKK